MGQLRMRGAVLTGIDTDADSVFADNLEVESHVFLDDGFTASGAIWLLGARIGGQLIMRGASLEGANAEGNSLIGDNLQVDNDLQADGDFTAAGAIRLIGARIGRQLSMRGCHPQRRRHRWEQFACRQPGGRGQRVLSRDQRVGRHQVA